MILYLEIIKSVILGIIQGITEWLPVSSTGHMILVNEFLNLNFSEEFTNMFFVVIQLGSILAVVVLYFEKLWPFYFKSKTKEQRKETWVLWFKVLLGCVPAGVVGLLFDDYIDAVFYNPLVIAIALIVYGIGFIIVESHTKESNIEKVEDIDWKTAIYIGLYQMLALIPGTSRSGSTILGGRLKGCSKAAVSEFSFFMAVPVMFGASGLKILKYGLDFTSAELIVMLVGCLVAFVVSILAIRFLMSFIRKHSFKGFGYYRIILGVAVILYFYILN